MDEDLKMLVTTNDGRFGVATNLQEIWHSPPVAFAEPCIEAVRGAVEKLNVPAKEMVSGAGHDAVYVSRVSPTSMIFHSLCGWFEP